MTSNERRKRAAELHNKKLDEQVAAREARRAQLEQIRAQWDADDRSGTPVVVDVGGGRLIAPTPERPKRKKVVVGGIGHLSSTTMLMSALAMIAADSSVNRNVIDSETRNAYRKPRTVRHKK